MASIDLDLTDIFDNVCDIRQDDASTGSYGHTTNVAGTVLKSAVPCKLLPDTRRGVAPSSDKSSIVSKFILYINPVVGVTFSENLWVVINTVRYDIKEVVEPVITGAPYELRMFRVKP